MPTAATLLMIATVLGASEPTLDGAEPALDASEGSPAVELVVDSTPAPLADSSATEPALGTVSSDPLYDRLFAQAPDEGEAEPASTSSKPKLPPWLWLLGLGGMGGLYYARKRQRSATPDQGQVEVLGHTRMGTRARLTVIRVVGEDGRKRRLLVSTGEGTPSLVADLGAESEHPQGELASSSTDVVPSAQPASAGAGTFSAVLNDAVTIEDEVIDDETVELDDGVGIPAIPPPKVPIWNETPDEFVAEVETPSQVAASAPTPQPPAAATPAPQSPPPPSTLERLESMLGDDEAPELVMDVGWDPDTGWSGLPDLAPTEQAAAPASSTALESPPQAPASAELDYEPEASRDELLCEPAERSEPFARAGVRPASRAAFEALLSGGGRQPAEPSRGKRIRPTIHTVKPLRPSQVSPSRRTPYDAMITQDDDGYEPEPRPAPHARSAEEVHDLVAEVLNERDDDGTSTAAHTRGNGVVELARYLRRQVAP